MPFSKLSLFAFFSYSVLASGATGFTGAYELKYTGESLVTSQELDTDAPETGKPFDASKVSVPVALKPIYVLHDPTSGVGSIRGADSRKSRLCKGDSAFFEIALRCEPTGFQNKVDERSGCEMKSFVTEGLSFSIFSPLTYERTEVVSLQPTTECGIFKDNLRKDLVDDSAEPFFKLAATSFNGGKEIPDVLAVTHRYSTLETTAEANPDKTDLTGAYLPEYAASSFGKSLRANSVVKGDVFDVAKFHRPEALGAILLFHDPAQGKIRLAGAGFRKLRSCPAEETAGTPTRFLCKPLLKAFDEDLATGCKIEHETREEISVNDKGELAYEKIEQRTLLAETAKGCQAYKAKLKTELANGSAELFFRILSKTGALGKEELGDQFQLVHRYAAKP